MNKEQFREKFERKDLKNGEYTIKELKGAGGQGAVFLAEDNHDQSLVAVKIFDSAMEGIDIRKEAKAHARMHHPNTIPMYWHDVEQRMSTDNKGARTEENYPFIVMMYANQGSLRDHVRKKGTILPVEESVDYLVQAANGIQHAHNKTIVHRDLKPENLLLHQHPGNDHLDLMVSDFGLAIRAHTGRPDDPFSNQKIGGTLPYMPPEQFEGEATKKSDTYSLGIVAFELLTGRRPFNAPNNAMLYIAHKTQAPLSFEQVRGNQMTHVLGELEGVVRKALEKRPEERQSGIGDFGQELKDTYERATGKAAKEKQIIDIAAKRQKLSLRDQVDHMLKKYDPIPAGEPITLDTEDGILMKRFFDEKKEAKEKRDEILKEDLVDIVRQSMQRRERNKGTERTLAEMALAIHDKTTARKLIPKLLGKKNLHYYKDAGRLAAMIGDTATAENLIQKLEENDFKYEAGDIAAELPDKTTAKRLIRKFEAEGESGCFIANIVIQIGDKVTAEKLMKKMDVEGFSSSDTYYLPDLVKLVPENHALGKKLMQKVLKQQKEWNYGGIDAGEIAAVLGDKKTVDSVIKDCEENGKYYFAGKIAAMAGDSVKAEEMIWKFKENDRNWGCSIWGMIPELAPDNLETAVKIIKKLEQEGFKQEYTATRVLRVMQGKPASKPL